MSQIGGILATGMEAERGESARAGRGRHRLTRLGQMASLLGLLGLTAWGRSFLLRDAFPTCPMRVASGKPCPLCGMTRAVAHALHGDWGEAWRYNALWPIVAGVTVLLLSLMFWDAVTGRNATGPVANWLANRWGVMLVVLITYGVLRVALGTGI